VDVWALNDSAEPVSLEIHIYGADNREILTHASLVPPTLGVKMGNFTAGPGDFAIVVQTPGRALPVRLFEGNLAVKAGDAWLVRFTADAHIVRETKDAVTFPFPGR
jgi:hypothetical protein